MGSVTVWRVSANTRNKNCGKGVIEAISEQLQKELPGLRGFPQLLNKLDVDEVELVLPVPNTYSSVKTVNETVKVSDTQEWILQLLFENEDITYEEIAQKMGISRATVGRHISILKKKGVLKRIGEDKNGSWLIIAH